MLVWNSERPSEFSEIICKILSDICTYIFLRRNIILRWVPLRQSLKQEFGCMRESPQGEKTKGNRTRHRIKPREKVASPQVQLQRDPIELAAVLSLWVSHGCWGMVQGNLVGWHPGERGSFGPLAAHPHRSRGLGALAWSWRGITYTRFSGCLGILTPKD